MAIKRSLSSSSLSTSDAKRSHSQISLPTKSDWSELLPELLELILAKLSFANNIRFKSICSSWFHVAESFTSDSLYSPFTKLPYLMLHCPAYDIYKVQDKVYDTRYFYSFENSKLYTLKEDPELFSYGGGCVGSSHGWLIIRDFSTDEPSRFFLYNPFSKSRITIPLYQDQAMDLLPTKVILTSDPSHDKDYGVVLIEDFYDQRMLFFFRKGDSDWSTIRSETSGGYTDIISRNDLVYALKSDISIEIWDFHDSLPILKREIRPSTPRKLSEATNTYISELYSSQKYLVDSSGNLMLVVRFIGNFINEDGEVFEPFSDEDITDPWIYPYETKMFHVYQLDSSEKHWEEVESLQNQALFVGVHHSMSISVQESSGYKMDSIYFTDDI